MHTSQLYVLGYLANFFSSNTAEMSDHSSLKARSGAEPWQKKKKKQTPSFVSCYHTMSSNYMYH